MATCAHGYPPSQCLICQALGTAPVPAPTATATRGRFRLHRSAPPIRSPYDPPVPAGRAHHPLATVALAVLAVVVVAVGIWIVLGAVFALLRLIELVAVAGVAGWIGYRVGHWRGRHDR